ncbi:zinc-binding dehydrogenase [Glycomyces sp. NPDC021274]|uniref:zinc-binding dehydrogenase n=1 Tax=Glycomyces sp. NPDC021274 TaxID=3155120 RepID=UPI0033C37EFD
MRPVPRRRRASRSLRSSMTARAVVPAAADLPADVFAHQLRAIADGRLHVAVAGVYRGLEQVRDARTELESGTTPGKHVVVLA